ncbi:hypothetical protein FRB95_002527 [Tulasnella sp. JGI-2019a]|nr:hypothetical protein FRB95_002527 [Tulasnella sp. JGI-2019a]
MASKALHEGYNLHISRDDYVLEPTDSSPQTSRRLWISRKTGNITLSQPGDAAASPAQQVLPAYGIMGILSLSTSDFLIVITARSLQGRIDGHPIYLATDYRILPLSPPSYASLLDHPVEKHLLRLVEKHLYGGKFWFSYGWDLTRRLQAQATTSSEGKAMWEMADDRFFWNKYLHSRFIDLSLSNSAQDLSRFILPMIYGTFDLRPTQINHIPFLMCIISRRSRYRAGTRYFTRGLDASGHAANFNETEQLILCDTSPNSTMPQSAIGGGFGVVEGRNRMSFVQTRGSAPIGFAEINTLRYIVDLTIMSTPEMAEAHKTHILEQIKTYGKQVLVNLVKSTGRERYVKEEYERLVKEAKFGEDRVQYQFFDFHKECSKMRFDRVSLLVDQIEPALYEGGYFHQSVYQDGFINTQKSVVRSNCMDCLDRTNVAQSAIAKRSLTQQLRAAGILVEKDVVDNHAEFMQVFRNMWADHGNAVSQAYAGSPAMKVDFTRTGKRTREGMAKDFWSGVTRYFKNNFFDGERQDAFDLFTGAWIARGGPNTALALVTDSRPLIVRSMPYVLLFSGLMIGAALSLPRSSAYPLLYFIMFWAIIAALSFTYIASHGVEYVSWPRLNPPVDALFYDGPGHKTGMHGRGKSLNRLPLPAWVKQNVLGTMRKMPVLHKLEEIEMGTTAAKKRVD